MIDVFSFSFFLLVGTFKYCSDRYYIAQGAQEMNNMTTTQQIIDEAQIDDSFMSEAQRTEFHSLIDCMTVWDAYDAALQTR